MRNPAMKRLFLSALLLLIANWSTAQEDCFDGIDNDGDGLIDLNDPDGCDCDPAEGDESIYNGDFESFFACPNSFSAFPVTSETNATPYTNYFVNGGSTDYFNSCGYVGGSLVPDVTPMLGAANGEGIVGFFFDGDSVGGYREYITQCLQIALQPGIEYTMTFEVATSGFYESEEGTSASVLTECSSLPMGLYGYPDCPYDIGLNNYNACLSEAGDYISLLEMEVDVQVFEFTEYTFTFTVPEEITSLSIGPGCTNPSCVGVEDPSVFNSNFFYFDNWSVTTSGTEGLSPPDFSVTGNSCQGFTFEVDDEVYEQYQWFVNGVAVNGETDLTFSLPADSLPEIRVGALFTDADGNEVCTFSEPFQPVSAEPFEIVADFETVICPDVVTTITLEVLPSGEYSFDWSTGETTQNIEAGPGEYEVEVTDTESGCTESLTLVIESCEDQILFVAVDDQSVCLGESAVVLAEVQGDNPPFAFSWSFGNGPGPFTINPDESETYNLTVTDALGNSVETSFTVSVFSGDDGDFDLGNDTLLCSNTPFLIGVENPLPGVNYLWNTGSEEATIAVTQSGIYSLTAETPCGTFFDEIEIETASSFSLPAPPDSLFYCRDSEAKISLIASDFYDLRWSDGVIGGSRTFPSDGNYTLEIVSACGFEQRVVSVREVNCDCQIFAPNAFTPNADGLNDVFTIKTECAFESFSVRIFNRWGEEVFSSSEPDFVWRGEDRNNSYYSGPTVYNYLIEALPEPVLFIPKPLKVRGSVTVVR